MINALSIDLEDWFCTYNVSGVIKPHEWGRCELRVVGTTRRLLSLLEKYQTKATFFVLGWVAERTPELINEVVQHGHEIGAHGYCHKVLTAMTPSEFEEDLARTRRALADCSIQQEVIGFRAPSFSVVESTKWALEVLARCGFKYDSSVFPVGFHPDYGVSQAPLVPYKTESGLIEFPLSCIEIFGKRLPCSGGAYFRIFPYAYTRYAIRRCNSEGRPVVFYIHPWELDTEQPRVRMTWHAKFRQYFHLERTEERLERLLAEFKFTTLKNVLGL